MLSSSSFSCGRNICWPCWISDSTQNVVIPWMCLRREFILEYLCPAESTNLVQTPRETLTCPTSKWLIIFLKRNKTWCNDVLPCIFPILIVHRFIGKIVPFLANKCCKIKFLRYFVFYTHRRFIFATIFSPRGFVCNNDKESGSKTCSSPFLDILYFSLDRNIGQKYCRYCLPSLTTCYQLPVLYWVLPWPLMCYGWTLIMMDAAVCWCGRFGI